MHSFSPSADQQSAPVFYYWLYYFRPDILRILSHNRLALANFPPFHRPRDRNSQILSLCRLCYLKIENSLGRKAFSKVSPRIFEKGEDCRFAPQIIDNNPMTAMIVTMATMTFQYGGYPRKYIVSTKENVIISPYHISQCTCTYVTSSFYSFRVLTLHCIYTR